jgi:acyl dehydratase
MRTFTSVEDLKNAVGEELGTTEWLTVDQSRVDRFAEATDDHQWIHVDEGRAKDGPFGGTIAHGYLTLSLLPRFTWELYTIEGTKAGINYGLNRVRFIHPVRVGSRIRSTATLTTVDEVPSGAQLVVSHRVDVEVEGTPKLACVAETISRVLF